MKRSIGLALVVAAGTFACNRNKDKAPPVQTAAVTRRSIVIDAQATGAVEPINVVEVKSKASGLITKMPVETGALVKPGDLLVQIDTRDVQNQYNQSDADLKAAQAKLQVSEAQKKRNDELFKARVITSQEHETTALDFENAKAAVVRALANLDLAKQRLEDATVTAPVAGTILEKSVSLGQVITSATSAFGGGTTLVKMADLNRVRVRALFNETDIGQVHPGQQSTVTVDAYPDRRFQGTVEKIEPQAVIQQNVTMFPVLVTLDNREGLLKPGMNGEVSVLVDQVNDVLAVPNDAIKNVREAAATAAMLGLNVDSVQAEVRAQFQGGGFGAPGGRNGGARGGARQGGGLRTGAVDAMPGNVRTVATSSGDVEVAEAGAQWPQQGQQPEVTDAQCAAVKAAFARKPEAQKQLDGLRAKVRSGELDFTAVREQSQKIYASLGLDPRIAGACRRREMMAGGGAQGNAAPSGAQNPRSGAGRASGRNTPQGAATGPGGEALRLAPSEGPAAERRTRPGLVFVVDSAKNTYHPRIVLLGAGNYDYTEVVSGVKEGERVALLTALALQSQRQQFNDRIRQGMGVPGMTQGGGGRGAPRGGGR